MRTVIAALDDATRPGIAADGAELTGRTEPSQSGLVAPLSAGADASDPPKDILTL